MQKQTTRSKPKQQTPKPPYTNTQNQLNQNKQTHNTKDNTMYATLLKIQIQTISKPTNQIAARTQ